MRAEEQDIPDLVMMPFQIAQDSLQLLFSAQIGIVWSNLRASYCFR